MEKEFAGVPMGVIVAIGIVIVVCGILWVWDMRQSLTRQTKRADACEEDQRLDALAASIDKHLSTPPAKPLVPTIDRRRPRPV